jgi:AraC-like DNA-binding protein/preprotein translocase subunit Sss1
MHVQLSVVRDIIYGAVSRGADFSTLCRAVGVDAAQLNVSENPVSYELAGRAWREAVKATGDDLLGLHLGENLGLTILGMIGYLMQNSSTAYEGIASLCRYNNLYTTVFKYELIEHGEEIEISFEPSVLYASNYPDSARQAVELSMAGTLSVYRNTTGKKLCPVRAELKYARRAVPEYEKILNCPVVFNRKGNKLILRRKDLLVKQISYDKSLFAFFSDALQQRLAALESTETYTQRLKHILLSKHKGRILAIDVAASCMGMTPRSLQRKLQLEGTTFRAVADSLRKEMAQRLAKDRNFKIKEIASFFGYADANAFRKATRRWERTKASPNP